MLQIKKKEPNGRQNSITETSEGAWVDILFRPVHLFTSLSHDAGRTNNFLAELNCQIKPRLMRSLHFSELGSVILERTRVLVTVTFREITELTN